MSWVEFFYGIVLFHVLSSESKGFLRIVSSLWWVSGASRNSLQNKIIKQFIVQYIWKGRVWTLLHILALLIKQLVIWDQSCHLA